MTRIEVVLATSKLLSLIVKYKKDYGTSSFRAEDYPELDKFIELLVKNERETIRARGEK